MCATSGFWSVRQAGKRIRMTAQLLDVANGFHLWSERYDQQRTRGRLWVTRPEGLTKGVVNSHALR